MDQLLSFFRYLCVSQKRLWMQQLRSRLQSGSSKDSTPINAQKQWLSSLPTSTILSLSLRSFWIPSFSKYLSISCILQVGPISHSSLIQNSSEYWVATSLNRFPMSKPTQLREANSKSMIVSFLSGLQMQFVMFTSLCDRIIFFGSNFQIFAVMGSPNSSLTILFEAADIRELLCSLSQIFLLYASNLPKLRSLRFSSFGQHFEENSASWVTRVSSIYWVTSVSDSGMPYRYF